MIDIVERGKNELELIMHFINKNYSPLQSPEIKRFRMNVDEHTQEFLMRLEEETQKNSKFYLPNP